MLMAVVSSGVVVRTASAAVEANNRTFNALVSGTVTVSMMDETNFELAGTGTASHLGKLRSYMADGELTKFDAEGVPTEDILVETLTAANGDTLIIKCDQILEVVGPGVFRGTDTWTVIGGTGRFSSATGFGSGVTNVDLNVGTFTKDLTGRIDY